MTSTSSASATALPDRRHFLSTFGAAGALGLGAGPALALNSPDADLIALGALLATAEAYNDALSIRCDEAHESYEPPDMPDAIFWRRSDFPAVWINKHRLDSIGYSDIVERYTYASDGVLEGLRETAAGWRALPPVERSYQERFLARVEEITAAVEAYGVEEAKRLAACGYTAATEAADAQQAIVDGLALRIATTSALTSEGVRIKVRAARRGTAEHLQSQLTRILEQPDRLCDETRDMLLISAMIDAGKIGASSVRAAA